MRRIILFFAVATLLLTASVYAEDKLLKPVRSSVELDNYQIDISEAKVKKVSEDKVALNMRITDSSKNFIKPKEVVLTTGTDTIKPLSRKDHSDSSKESGLPVGAAVSSSGSVGVGLGISFGGGKSSYSYTTFEFGSKDFHSGAKLKIVLPEKKELSIQVSSIAE